MNAADRCSGDHIADPSQLLVVEHHRREDREHRDHPDK